MSKEAIILKSDASGRVLVPVERPVELVREVERSGAEAITAVVKATTGSFWDAYLKASPAAKAALKTASVMEPWKLTARITCK